MPSYYQMGLARQSSQRYPLAPRDSVGGWRFWEGQKTPGMIREEIERINAEWNIFSKELFREIEESGGYSPSRSGDPLQIFWRDVFSPAYQRWESFRNQHQSWTSNMWGDTWDDARNYQAQLIDLRKKAKDVGFALKYSIDPVRREEVNLTSALGGVGALLKYGLVAGAIFLVFLIIRSLRS